MKTRISLFILMMMLAVSCATNRSAITQHKRQANNHRVQAESRSPLPCPPAKYNATSKVSYKPINRRLRTAKRNVNFKSTHRIPFINRKPDAKLVRINKPSSINSSRVQLPEPLAENTPLFPGSLNPSISLAREPERPSFPANYSVLPPIAVMPFSKTTAYVDSWSDAALNSNVKSNPTREEGYSYYPLNVAGDINEEAGSSMIDMRITKRARLLLFTLLSGIVGFLGLGLATIKNKKALQISVWAARNKRSSRILVAILNILLPIGGFFVGAWLTQLGLDLPDYTKLATIGFLGITGLSYPLVRSMKTDISHHYRRRKLHDLLMVLGSILFFIAVGNNHFSEKTRNLSQENLPFSEYIGNNSIGENSLIAGTNYTAGDWVLDQINTQQPPNKRKMKTGAIVLLTILSTVFLVASGYGLFALSCSIACSGYDVAALFVFFGGAAGLITLFIVSLKAIFRRESVFPDTPAR